jgi:MFS family permease
MGDPAPSRDWKRYAKASNLLGSLAAGLVSPFTVLFALALGADPALIGLMVSLPPLMTTLMQLLWARVTRLTGRRKPFVLASAILNSVMWALMGFAQSPTYLVVLVGVQALLTSIGAPAASGLLSSLLSDRERGQVIGELDRFAYLGATVGTLLAGPTLDALGTQLGYRSVFLGASAVNLLSILAYNMGMPDLRIEPAKHAQERLPAKRGELLLKLVLVRSMFTIGVAIAGPYVMVYLVERYALSNTAVAVMTVSYYLLSITTARGLGSLVDRFGRVPMLTIGSVLTSLTPLLTVLWSNVYLASTGFISGGISWETVNISLSAYLMDITKGGDVEGSVALFNAAMGISSAIGPLIGGAIASFTGDITCIFYISGALRILFGLACYFYLKEAYPHVEEVTIRRVLSPFGTIGFEIEKGVRLLAYVASGETVQRVVDRLGRTMREVEEEEQLAWIEEF